jgi:hypothetical protein
MGHIEFQNTLVSVTRLSHVQNSRDTLKQVDTTLASTGRMSYELNDSTGKLGYRTKRFRYVVSS